MALGLILPTSKTSGNLEIQPGFDFETNSSGSYFQIQPSHVCLRILVQVPASLLGMLLFCRTTAQTQKSPTIIFSDLCHKTLGRGM